MLNPTRFFQLSYSVGCLQWGFSFSQAGELSLFPPCSGPHLHPILFIHSSVLSGGWFRGRVLSSLCWRTGPGAQSLVPVASLPIPQAAVVLSERALRRLAGALRVQWVCCDVTMQTKVGS